MSDPRGRASRPTGRQPRAGSRRRGWSSLPLGGEVRLDEKATGRPIVEIRLRTTRVADDQLGDLRGLSSLRTLDLTQTRISDAGLARLRGHEGLRSLLVYDTRVTDRGLEHIATMSGLEKLLSGTLTCPARG